MVKSIFICVFMILDCMIYTDVSSSISDTSLHGPNWITTPPQLQATPTYACIGGRAVVRMHVCVGLPGVVIATERWSCKCSRPLMVCVTFASQGGFVCCCHGRV